MIISDLNSLRKFADIRKTISCVKCKFGALSQGQVFDCKNPGGCGRSMLDFKGFRRERDACRRTRVLARAAMQLEPRLARPFAAQHRKLRHSGFLGEFVFSRSSSTSVRPARTG
jgi:hypothetical protein